MIHSEIRYGIVQTEYVRERDSRIGYGVALYDAEGAVLLCAHDLSGDRQAVKVLVDLCNRLHLSPLHFHDVMEDYLS